MLEYHDVDINFVDLKYRIQNVNYITHAKKHVYNYSSSFFMNYAMISVSLFGWKITLYLNTNENVSLCDRDLLFNRNIYGLVYDFKFIIITEITDIQVCDEYIDTKILLDSNKIPVRIKTYLVNNLQSDLIIDMNVLNKDDIDLLLTCQALKIKDIEISLCYTSSIESKIYINWIFYHFMTHTNSHDITPLITRKWKFISRLMAELKSSSFSINEKKDRSNSATFDFSHESLTYSPFTSASKFALVFNKKSAESKFMCQSTEIEAEKLKNRNVASNRFSRQCRHCKQSFISENLLHRHVPHCNESTKEFKHARMTKKLNGPWRKPSNWRYFIDFSLIFH